MYAQAKYLPDTFFFPQTKYAGQASNPTDTGRFAEASLRSDLIWSALLC